MEQYNMVMVGSESALQKARAYAQKFMPFNEHGDPNGWVFSKETMRYIGECQVLKTIRKKVAETAAEAFKSIEGLLILPIATSKLEVN